MALWATYVASEGLDEVSRNPTQRTPPNQILEMLGLKTYQKSYALVVGISDFDAFADLPTQNDALQMRDYLINEAGFDYVHTLTEEKVTKERLERLFLDEFRPLVGENDRFLFYWSGHGVTLNHRKGEVGFLPLADSDRSLFSTMVAMRDIDNWDGFLNAHQVLYLLDSCFSGLAGFSAKSDLEDITRAQLSGPARHMITAGRDTEETIAVDALGGSLFTYAVLDGLRGRADTSNALGSDGLITVGELKQFVSQEVERQRRSLNWPETITPQLRDLIGSDGSFFFPVLDLLAAEANVDVSGDGRIVPKGATPKPDPDHDPVEPASINPKDVVFIQIILFDLGYNPGVVDGIWGIRTKTALEKFQQDQNLPVTATLDAETELALIHAVIEMKKGDSVEFASAKQSLEFPSEPQFDIPSVGAVAQMAAPATVPDQIFAPAGTLCDACLEMVSIPRGEAGLGSDTGPPEARPSTTRDIETFFLSTTEVTRGAFARYVAATGITPEADSCYQWADSSTMSRTADAFSAQERHAPDDYPQACVSLNDALGYIDWLNQQATGVEFRLPTEAEFEYAQTLGLEITEQWNGDGPSCAMGNRADQTSPFIWRDDTCEDPYSFTAPVAAFLPDGLGLYDMGGNLWEWVADCWTPDHDTIPALSGCETGTIKGASFDDPPENLAPYTRQPAPAKRRQTNIGFRLAMDFVQ